MVRPVRSLVLDSLVGRASDLRNQKLKGSRSNPSQVRRYISYSVTLVFMETEN